MRGTSQKVAEKAMTKKSRVTHKGTRKLAARGSAMASRAKKAHENQGGGVKPGGRKRPPAVRVPKSVKRGRYSA